VRLMVYSHDTFGLGNIRRMLAICHHLHATLEDLSILIVSGSPMLQSFRVAKGIDYIKLPCLKRAETGELGVKFLPMEAEEVIRLRRELLLSTVISFRPDVVLVDKKPDGLAGELEPALRHIRCALPETQVNLVLRDILDAPKKTVAEWGERGYNNVLHWYYDQILVLGQKSVFDVCEEYRIPPAIARKVKYCGYVARYEVLEASEKVRERLGIERDAALVLATAGGGEDGFRLMQCSIEAARLVAEQRKVQIVVVAGPELATEQHRQLGAAAAMTPQTKLVEFLPDMLSHMHAADVVISMGGYNTVCELATLHKRAVVVPRAEPVQEQSMRMERMAGLGQFETLALATLDPRALANAVLRQLEAAEHRTRSDWHLDMGALPRIARLIGEFHGRRDFQPHGRVWHGEDELLMDAAAS
jgi:predicted glycosyltransferase